MTRALLDVNLLLALLDTDHVNHWPARDWFIEHISIGWASCAITQNGFVRVISQPSYPSAITISDAVSLLARATAADQHEFWPCGLSMLDTDVIDPSRLHGHRQVTDAYLLALAVANGGRLVTFDQSVPLSAVRNAAEEHLDVI